MLVVCLLIGIFAMIALPDFAGMIKSERLVAQSNDLVSDISFARGEAMRRGKRVAICPTSDQSTCGNNWSEGRMVFVDDDVTGVSGARSASEELLRVRGPLAGGNSLTWSGEDQCLQFRSSGVPSKDGAAANKNCYSSAATQMREIFKLCDATVANQGRQIFVSMLGPIEVKREGVTCP